MLKFELGGRFRGVVAYMLECDIVDSEFELQSNNSMPFGLIPKGKVWIFLSPIYVFEVEVNGLLYCRIKGFVRLYLSYLKIITHPNFLNGRNTIQAIVVKKLYQGLMFTCKTIDDELKQQIHCLKILDKMKTEMTWNTKRDVLEKSPIV